MQVDANLKEFRYRIVPRVIAEQSFWGRYFKACRDIRRELLPGEPPEADFGASECPSSDTTEAVRALGSNSGSNGSRGRTSAATTHHAIGGASDSQEEAPPSPAAADGPRAQPSSDGVVSAPHSSQSLAFLGLPPRPHLPPKHRQQQSRDSQEEVPPSVAAVDGPLTQPQPSATDVAQSACHTSQSVAFLGLPPRPYLPAKHRRQHSRDSCDAAAEQWPDMTARTVARGATIAARAFSDVTRWVRPLFTRCFN